VGEGGCIIGPPTLVNAIADALSPFGELRLELPLTPSKILELIEGRPISQKASGHGAAPSSPVSAPPASAPEITPAPAAKQAEPVVAAAPPPQEETGNPAIDGMWKFVLASPVGPQYFKGRLATNGDVLTGIFYMNSDEAHFTGTVSGNNLKWDLKVTKPMSITLKYDVQVEGDKLAGKVKMGFFGTSKLTGERT
jgi:carbon-monoxide dehydrogenase large subunit